MRRNVVFRDWRVSASRKAAQRGLSISKQTLFRNLSVGQRRVPVSIRFDIVIFIHFAEIVADTISFIVYNMIPSVFFEILLAFTGLNQVISLTVCILHPIVCCSGFLAIHNRRYGAGRRFTVLIVFFRKVGNLIHDDNSPAIWIHFCFRDCHRLSVRIDIISHGGCDLAGLFHRRVPVLIAGAGRCISDGRFCHRSGGRGRGGWSVPPGRDDTLYRSSFCFRGALARSSSARHWSTLCRNFRVGLAGCLCRFFYVRLFMPRWL